MTPPVASPQRYARIAGGAYAAVIVLGLLNGMAVDSRLIVAGDDAATVQNILANPTLFRIGMVATLVLYALVLVLAWALYELLRVVNARLARLGLFFRAAEAIVGVSTILASVFVSDLLGSEERIAALGQQQLQALVGACLETRTTGMDLVLVLIGVGGTVYCHLLFTSRLVPRWLSGWGVLTYLSMLALGTSSLLWPTHPEMLERWCSMAPERCSSSPWAAGSW